MERMPEQHNGHKQSPPLLPPQSAPSIQLLPQVSLHHLPDPPPHKKDKKVSLPPSINNFIQKTYSILQEKQLENIVSWAEPSEHFVPSAVEGQGMGMKAERPNGRPTMVSSFRIHNLRAFEEIVLPKYFKHSNMSSFVRQLNMYSFHKVRGDKNEIEFEHQKFIKNRPDLLADIKRKQVDSTSSIPSIALIPQNNQTTPLKQPDFIVEKIKSEKPIVSLQDANKSPQKKDSSSIGQKSGEEDQTNRLSQLKQTNASLKRIRHQKSLELKHLLSEKKNQNCDKFNKFIFALFAAKFQQYEQNNQKQSNIFNQAKEKKLEYFHKIIEHLMDSSSTKVFQEYLEMSQKLLLRDQSIEIQKQQ